MKKYLKDEVEYFATKAKTLTLTDEDQIQAFTNNEQLKELISGFLTIIAELREDMEEKSPIILQQLYSSLYAKNINNISKGIIEINPDKYYTNPILLNSNTSLTSEDCYFSLSEDITVWPIKIKKYEIIKSTTLKNLDVNTSHVIKITLTSLNIAIKKMEFNSLRFFIDGKDVDFLFKDLFLGNTQIEAYTSDSDEIKLKDSVKDFYKACQVEWFSPQVSEGIEILQDYGNIPEVYQFIYIKDIDLSNIFNDLCIYIPLNLSKNMELKILLWCVVVKNIFKCQTDAFKINLLNLQQKLIVNSFKKNLVIYQVNKCFILNNGVATELPSHNNQNWCSFNKDEDTFLCFLSDKIADFQNQWAYCDVVTHNGNAANDINFNSEIFLENYNNLICNFIVVPHYVPAPITIENLFQYLNTDYKKLLSSPEILQIALNNLLDIYNKKYFTIIENIEINNIIAHKKWGKDLVPIKGKKVTLFLKSNLRDPWLFLKILHKFIVDFSTLDIFIDLQIEWKGVMYVINEDISNA